MTRKKETLCYQVKMKVNLGRRWIIKNFMREQKKSIYREGYSE